METCRAIIRQQVESFRRCHGNNYFLGVDVQHPGHNMLLYKIPEKMAHIKLNRYIEDVGSSVQNDWEVKEHESQGAKLFPSTSLNGERYGTRPVRWNLLHQKETLQMTWYWCRV